VSQHEAAAKVEMAVAGTFTVLGGAGLTLHELLVVWQLTASAAAATIGGGFMAWRWWTGWRHNKRRDRREGDKWRGTGGGRA